MPGEHVDDTKSRAARRDCVVLNIIRQPDSVRNHGHQIKSGLEESRGCEINWLIAFSTSILYIYIIVHSKRVQRRDAQLMCAAVLVQEEFHELRDVLAEDWHLENELKGFREPENVRDESLKRRLSRRQIWGSILHNFDHPRQESLE